jgi:DNA polymerase III alpha subunit
MYPVEDTGLVKIDLLSQRGLGAIVDSVRMVGENYGVEIDFTAFDPTADPATREVVRTGRTIGCFYIESPG